MPSPQELTLEEYEKLQAEKRAALNVKTAEVKTIEVDVEFKGMKVRLCWRRCKQTPLP